MTTMLTQKIDDVDRIHARQQALEARVFLLAPSFSFWRGYYQLPSDKVTIDLNEKHIDTDSVTTPRAILLSDKYPCDRGGTPWKKRFQKIESRQKGLIERYSVPFPIRGVRIVPKSRGADFFRDMFGYTVDSLRRRAARASDHGDVDTRDISLQILNEFLAAHPQATPDTPVADPELTGDEQSVAFQLSRAADEFCHDLPGVYRQIQDRLDATVWGSIEDKLPRNSIAMRAKFGLDVTPVELAGGSTNAVTAEDLSEHAQLVREACRRKVDAAVEEIVQGPRQELAAAVANLQKLIADDGRVTARSFSPVRAAIEKIRMFDFVADASLLTQITAIETRLDRTAPTSLTSVAAASNGFSAALSTLMDEVTSAEAAETASREFGESVRSLQL